jgi:hypothetical protein
MNETTAPSHHQTESEELAELHNALTVEEAAREANVSDATMRNYVKRGLPVIKLPGAHARIKIRRRDLVDFMYGRLPVKPATAASTKAAA